ncbi:PIN domain nuclease, a component of toxin-antitoxin system (PIN domain) [Trichlorobacter thiogenes]|uniref:PIN domain nuclease, a component of toxin-antitoxin system (PIN domain) n=1 Tax=Trichlorobacter thiogenes TaxID=115783 RepID=A0A1T4K239_9BACT|nr:type II toxin-antitoxin system VapC family toxin [Trichlorobacter thiogenes]SJZ36511.1 PIN domain nuclease, a component of toxin-antitoxin system (PIN domain) [Trichlorobacter thiogenes]
MRLLLDTHIALWAISDDPRLSGAARALITAPENEIFVSAASIWEISIKYSLGRTNMPVSSAEALGWFRESGYRLLAISPEHAVAVEALAPLHADPFDRMLVAQALHEPLRLVTHDAQVARYSDTIIAV